MYIIKFHETEAMVFFFFSIERRVHPIVAPAAAEARWLRYPSRVVRVHDPCSFLSLEMYCLQ